MTTFEQLEELVYHGFKELRESFQETRERQQETDRQLKETDRQLKESERQLKETIQETNRQMRGITDSLGRFAEQMVQPAVVSLFHKRGIALTGVYHRLRQRRNGDTMEVDVLGEGKEAVVAIEVKLRLEVEDVAEFLSELPDFHRFFPTFRGHTLYGAVAGMSMEQNVVRYASRHGLFVLAPSGENVQIMNDKKFQPRVFGEPARKPSKKRTR
jgi:hypothetical protein